MLAGEGEGAAVFPGVVGTAVTKLCRWEVGRTGLTEREAREAGIGYRAVTFKGTARSGYMPDPGTVHVKVLAEEGTGRVLGAQLVGTGNVAKRIDVAATWCHLGVTVQEAQLFDLSYAPPFGGTWDLLQVAARKLVARAGAAAAALSRPAPRPQARDGGIAPSTRRSSSTSCSCCVRGEPREERRDVLLVRGEVAAQEVQALVGERDQDAAAVVGVRGAGDEALGLERVEQPGDRGPADQQALRQRARLERVALGVVQRHQHVERRERQPRAAQRLRGPARGGVVGPRQPQEHLRRQQVAAGRELLLQRQALQLDVVGAPSDLAGGTACGGERRHPDANARR